MTLLRPPVLAHPLTETYELPVSALFVSAVALVLLAAVAAASARRAAGEPTAEVTTAAENHEGVPFWVGRLLGLALFGLALGAGLLGDTEALANIAPALVLGAGWPLLVALSAVLPGTWQRLNPFDTLARVLAPLGAGHGSADNPNVAWAMPAAALWVAYATMWPNHLEPRTVGAALGAYTLATLAGCLALGRRTWLVRGDVFTVFLGMIGAVRRDGRNTVLPRNAHLVLAVLCGGFVYGLLRDSRLLIDIGYGPRATLNSAIALAACILVGVALAHAAHRAARRRGDGDAIAVAMVIAGVGLALALALARNRFTTSLQLLPVLASDPFGTGTLDLFGTRDWVLTARPLGTAGLIVAQLCLLVVGHLVAAAVAVAVAGRPGQTTRRRTLPPAVTLLAVFLAVSSSAVAATAL